MAMKAFNRSGKKAIKGAGAIFCTGVLGAMFSTQANASCVDPSATQGAAHPLHALALHAPSVRSGVENEDAAHKIVGTWHVTYSAGGAAYAEAFMQWHSDGTEWENIDFPILGGNICMGSWKSVDENRVTRYHVGWLYANGVLFGHFTETETDLLSHDGNSYTGTNDSKFYKLDGSMFQEVVGTSAATRISP